MPQLLSHFDIFVEILKRHLLLFENGATQKPKDSLCACDQEVLFKRLLQVNFEPNLTPHLHHHHYEHSRCHILTQSKPCIISLQAAAECCRTENVIIHDMK